jgi:hypothetical protein
MYFLGKYFCIFIICFFGSQAFGDCVLPVPDGDDTIPSPANIEGIIVSIKSDIVTIRSKLTKRKVSVRILKDKPIYSAFGGDMQTSELRIGQKAWVWFVGCKRGGKTTPVAAYFQIFSTDPNDQPK